MDIFTMHGIPHKTWIKEARRKPLSLFDRSMAWVEKKSITGSHIPTILPVSTLVKYELLKLYDIPESKIRVIHPGVSTDRFSVLDWETCRHEIRQRHGLSSSDVVVLFVGMNFEIKRLDLVIQGIAGLVTKDRRSYRLKLLVVGKGNKKRYLTMAHELRIDNRVIFAGVMQEVEKYYLASDIFAMPSRFDTFGLAVLEAMMAGLPVLITQRVGARDLVEPGVHGFILKEEPSPMDVTEKLALFMKKENRLKMGENAKKLAMQYTWEKRSAHVANLYKSLIKTGSLR